MIRMIMNLSRHELRTKDTTGTICFTNKNKNNYSINTNIGKILFKALNNKFQ